VKEISYCGKVVRGAAIEGRESFESEKARWSKSLGSVTNAEIESSCA